MWVTCDLLDILTTSSVPTLLFDYFYLPHSLHGDGLKNPGVHSWCHTETTERKSYFFSFTNLLLIFFWTSTAKGLHHVTWLLQSVLADTNIIFLLQWLAVRAETVSSIFTLNPSLFAVFLLADVSGTRRALVEPFTAVTRQRRVQFASQSKGFWFCCVWSKYLAKL